MGRTTAHPMVKLDPGDARSPVLQWYEIKKGRDSGGELLAAFELFMVSYCLYILPISECRCNTIGLP